MIAPILETPRLNLCTPILSDFDAYAAAWADADFARFVGGEPRSRATSWQKFVQMAGFWPLLGYGYWIIVDRTTRAFIGTAGLAQFDRGIAEIEGLPEAGWAISQSYWGQGYASEAVAAIVRWSDVELCAPETRCIIDPENTPSIRVAEKNGFTRIDEVENELGRSLVFSRRRS